MNLIKHPDPRTLADLAAGHLTGAKADVVIAHLSECEPCLALADRLWDEHLAEIAGAAIPDLDPEAAEQVEYGLWRRLRRSDLGGEMVRLSTRLLLSVWVALLQPLLGSRQTWSTRRRRR
ncbi:hypothetical protein ACFLYD_07510 [Chloroflexota bacterium]